MKTVEKLMETPAVAQALDFLKSDTEHTLKEQLEIVQIPAPSNDEGERTADFARRLTEMGYEPTIDKVGNVYVTIPGTDPAAPTVMVAGHLDTVFPRSLPLEVKEENGVYRCPGICDDTRTLAEVLSLARAFRQADLKPVGTVILCGNVGEEGLGDLRGVKELFRTLEIADVERIVDLELQGLMARTGRLGYKVKITEGAKRRLAAMGYESRYGVRSLKRTLMDNVEEPLSTLIIDGKLHEGDTVVVESDKAHGVKLRVA